jgi:hypothetical protein
MKKPDFEHHRQSLLRAGKPLPQQAREPYRVALVQLLEDTGLFLVQRARKDGHNEALIEIHASWVGTDYSPDAVIAALRDLWPPESLKDQKHWIEAEDEVVTLQFAASVGEGQFLTARMKVTV